MLPPNVKGILADCGYTSAKEIIGKVIGQMKLPLLILCVVMLVLVAASAPLTDFIGRVAQGLV